MDFFEVIIFCTYVEKKRTIYIYFKIFVNFYLYYKFQRFFLNICKGLFLVGMTQFIYIFFIF